MTPYLSYYGVTSLDGDPINIDPSFSYLLANTEFTNDSALIGFEINAFVAGGIKLSVKNFIKNNIGF